MTEDPNTPPKMLSTIYRFFSFSDIPNWYPCGFPMLSPRMHPYIVSMRGMLHIFGGSDWDSDTEFAECYDTWERSSFPLKVLPPDAFPMDNLVIAALPNYQILVACKTSNVAYLYFAGTGTWEELIDKIDFSGVEGKATLVLNYTLCWYNDILHELDAYDWNLKRWFKTGIRGLDSVGTLPCSIGCDPSFSLFSLDANHLGLLWIDQQWFTDSCSPFLHYTKVHVSMNKDVQGATVFDASVESSRSYVLEADACFLDAVVLIS